ncbi:MAG: tRNA (adenosine(37)-N6)-dimethylallyltransferase MiaA [Candidatus Lambdaproteobacteria bacterium]|nr:tRNA (adenosine(37)-N6)-dimethylallyltransferase MiaA [Candidatus Lambdaproteobacteria bacterium]
MHKLIAVVGPTASGKSELALMLAEALGGEIVNTDAMQVYRGLDIGTAKPDAALRARVRHHLLDVVAPDEEYSAGHYLADARRIIADLRARGRVPILCGGTGLYFRALLFGMADIPPVPPAVRDRVAALLAEQGLAAAHAHLAQVDPQAAARIHPNDPSRIARALEVFQATGRPLSDFHAAQPFHEAAPGVLSVACRWERATLYARIDARVKRMLAGGWVDEVRRLLSAGYGPQLKPLRSIGYREIAALLLGQRDEARLAEDIARRTRHYAKRQLTWFNKHPDIQWAPPGDEHSLLAAAMAFLGPED